ncbi:hypothetical protein B2G88_16675 [Natronolimnobius baerhuensis]|uniref:Blue (type 1) copper domain-containing protein n=1 Tax=Natronolimnobius baerhuensis TaxID=253108 RepID=A0A202E4A0_9EURY|nr:hypothetical protein B2G88_16675 [Natronolimnobius baerhuensis]
MVPEYGLSRRETLRLGSSALLVTLAAGCADEGPGEEDDGDESNDVEPDGALEPDTRILFDAQTSGWVGIEPDEIADEENPTLTLQAGEQYEIGWFEGDGATHNIELVDDNDDVVGDYQTDEAEEGGDEQLIHFEATDEIAQYVCRLHETTMRGDMQLEE